MERERVVAVRREREVVRATRREQVVATPAARSNAVARPINTVWERRGWQRQTTNRGEVYTGRFQAISPRTGQQHSYEGRIETGGGASTALVRTPPPTLLSEHPKAACFHHRHDGWYVMNWWRGTPDVDETIGYVEKVLVEALGM